MTAPDDRLVEYLKNAGRILIFTGAGISTGSGIPDYRGPQGVWKRRQPVFYQDFMSSEQKRLEYWDLALEGWEGYRDAKPNAIHFACARLERAGKVEMVVTQNIDGLHRKAGTSAEKLVEIHGTNLEVECQSCHKRDHPQAHFEYFKRERKAPECGCGGLIKPATISFGQSLRPEDMHRSAVPLAAAGRGVPYIVINRGPTDHDARPGLSLRLEGDVLDFFPPAVDAACPEID
jgi:NAD-dependent deacetylase